MPELVPDQPTRSPEAWAHSAALAPQCPGHRVLTVKGSGGASLSDLSRGKERKTSDKSWMRGIGQNPWLVLLNTGKVIRNKDSLRNHHNQEELRVITMSSKNVVGWAEHWTETLSWTKMGRVLFLFQITILKIKFSFQNTFRFTEEKQRSYREFLYVPPLSFLIINI